MLFWLYCNGGVMILKESLIMHDLSVNNHVITKKTKAGSSGITSETKQLTALH